MMILQFIVCEHPPQTVPIIFPCEESPSLQTPFTLPAPHFALSGPHLDPIAAKWNLVQGSNTYRGGTGQYGFARKATKASLAHCGISEGFPSSLLLFVIFQWHL